MQIPANTPITAGHGILDINSPKQTTPTPETTGEDTVKLSTYARAKQLKSQGASNSVIAAQLGLSAKTVESYFGTPNAEAAATTPQPFTPAHEAVQNTAVKKEIK
ncbi:MAG: hypothetical protein ACLQF0_03605 [Dissulfurispiraceae bacterium]